MKANEIKFPFVLNRMTFEVKQVLGNIDILFCNKKPIRKQCGEKDAAAFIARNFRVISAWSQDGQWMEGKIRGAKQSLQHLD